MKTFRVVPWTVMLLVSFLVLNSALMGQDTPKETDDDTSKLTKQFEALATELEEDLDDLADPLAAYTAEIKVQEKKVADLTKKHGADSKQAQRAAKGLARQKANLAAATKVVEDPKADTGSADPLAAYAKEIKGLEKRVADLAQKNGKDSKQVKRAQEVLSAKKQNLANLVEFVEDNTGETLAADPLAALAADIKVLEKKLAEVSKKQGKDSKQAKAVARALAAAKVNLDATNASGDDPAADSLTTDPLAAYAAEIKALEKKLAEVSKKHGKDSKEAKAVAKAIAERKASIGAVTNDPGDTPEVRIAELADRIAKCKDPKQKKELQAKLGKLKELLPKLNLGETETPEKE